MNEKKLNIVFVTNNYTPYQGGVVSSIQTTSQALRQLGHTVTIITLNFTNNSLHEPHVIRIFCPVRFMYKKNHMALPWYPQLRLNKLFAALNPDIVHIHHPFLLGSAALTVAKKKKIPTIFTYHTLYEQYLHYIPLPQQLTKPVVTKLVQSFCQEVDAVIAPGTFIKDKIAHHAPHKLIEVIPSSIAPHFFQYQLPLDAQHPYKLLSISRFTQEKNIPFLLDVMALLDSNNFTLTLAGYGFEYKALQQYAYSIKKLTSKQVIFVEKPSKTDLLQFYQQAHVFLFASTSDTQGLVLAEAMSQATPVIALDGPGQRDIIEQGVNGFLVHNQQEMAEKIVQLTQNSSLYQSMQQESLKTAQKYHSDHLVTKLVNFYYKVL